MTALVKHIKDVAVEAAQSLGCDSLKKEQMEVVVKFVTGNDVFAILPTGFGKSLCYACLPAVFNKLNGTNGSIVVVITLLMAITEDQVCVHVCVPTTHVLLNMCS